MLLTNLFSTEIKPLLPYYSFSVTEEETCGNSTARHSRLLSFIPNSYLCSEDPWYVMSWEGVTNNHLFLYLKTLIP